MKITKVTTNEVTRVKVEVKVRAKVRVEARAKMRAKVVIKVGLEAPNLAILTKIPQIRTRLVLTPKKMTQSPRVAQTNRAQIHPHDQIKIGPEF